MPSKVRLSSRAPVAHTLTRIVSVIVIFCTVTSATYWKNGRAWSGVLAYCVAILGAILVNVLPLTDRVGLLFSYWIAVTEIAPFVVMLAWVGSTTAGHTKRTIPRVFFHASACSDV